MVKQFLEECKEVRNDFVKIAGQYNVSSHLKLRTEIDSLLIMYDQLCERVQIANANEVETSRQDELLRDYEDWKQYNEHHNYEPIEKTIERFLSRNCG